MLPMRFFRDDFFPDMFGKTPDMFEKVMKTDIKEVGDNMEMEIDFPGFNKEDLSISIKDGMLLIEGTRNVNKDEKDSEGNYIRRERFTGRTSRSYYIGDVSEDDVKASFENGVLKVTYPKAKEALPEQKKILIE